MRHRILWWLPFPRGIWRCRFGIHHWPRAEFNGEHFCEVCNPHRMNLWVDFILAICRPETTGIKPWALEQARQLREWRDAR